MEIDNLIQDFYKNVVSNTELKWRKIDYVDNIEYYYAENELYLLKDIYNNIYFERGNSPEDAYINFLLKAINRAVQKDMLKVKENV